MLPGTPDKFTNFLALEPVLGANGQLEIRMENDSSGRILYVGYSLIPNAPTNELVWMICKLSYDSNNYLNRKQLPDDGSGMIYAWDNRAALFS